MRIRTILKDYIENLNFKESDILKKYSHHDLYESIEYLFSNRLYRKKFFFINFLVTSKAEVRIFTPLLEFLFKTESIEVNVIYLNKHRFDRILEDKLISKPNFNITKSVYPILKSFRNKNAVNVICLDFKKYFKYHKIGLELIGEINLKGGKTVCIQHGGIQEDNVQGQISSISNNQIVFGTYMYERLSEKRSEKELFLTGNPLHDKLVTGEKKIIGGSILSLIKNRKVILLATCLHTEYDYRFDAKLCYSKYIREVYNSINFNKYFLIIKMHPNDDIQNNIYEQECKLLNLSDKEVLIEPPHSRLTFYDYLNISDLLISRASTVIEEALIFGKLVLAFDLFEDGPINSYNSLKIYKNYLQIIGDRKDLVLGIENLLTNKERLDNLNTNLISFNQNGLASNRVYEALLKIGQQQNLY
ncbi:UDP-N-acetylglucosamine 2-epimerase [Aestuariibaculum sediminum]|uniref:UDP-N-acetylglucosamine 2-epimerase n=1 Tax=Aestuariibaculum sediminum TaxID=2770637 RepID=A0A8J6UHM3_9FLAO|nr:UDP-N-acetylglucosamine 2-epimerase [Aestuariibaculum sediminum]MBD0833086.1 UDP-N-acetylglucosamine 2-epimerase [Aestuariibaculum sediminum]